MAYPMTPLPEVGEVLRRLAEEHGCTVGSEDVMLNGEPHTIRFVARELDGETREYVVTAERGQHITPTVLRSLCRALGVDPAAFGLTLG